MHFRYVQKISVRKTAILCKQLDNSFSILNKTQEYAFPSTAEECHRRRVLQNRSRSMPAREQSTSKFQHGPDYKNIEIAKKTSSTSRLTRLNVQNLRYQNTRDYSTFIEKLKSMFGIGVAAPQIPMPQQKEDLVTKETPKDPPTTKKVEDDVEFEKSMEATKPKQCKQAEEPQFSMPDSQKLDVPPDDANFFSEERICKECPDLRAIKLQRDHDLKQAALMEKHREEADSKDMYESEEHLEGKENEYASESRDDNVACDKSLKCGQKLKLPSTGCDSKIVSDKLAYAVLSDKDKSAIDGQFCTQNPLVTKLHVPQDWNQTRHLKYPKTKPEDPRRQKSGADGARIEEGEEEGQSHKPEGNKGDESLLSAVVRRDNNKTPKDQTREEATSPTLDRVFNTLRDLEAKRRSIEVTSKSNDLFYSLQDQRFVSFKQAGSLPPPAGASIFIPGDLDVAKKLKTNLPSPNVLASQLPAVIPPVATQLALPDFKRELKQEIKEEITKEIKSEVKREVKHEIKQEVKYDLAEDFKENLKQEVKLDCLMEAVKQEMKVDLCEDLRDDLKREMRDDIKYEIQAEIKECFQNDIVMLHDDEDSKKDVWKGKVQDAVEEFEDVVDSAKRNVKDYAEKAKVKTREVSRDVQEVDWKEKAEGFKQELMSVKDKARAAEQEIRQKIEDEKKKRGKDDFMDVDKAAVADAVASICRVVKDDLVLPEKTLGALRVDADVNIDQRKLFEDELNAEVIDPAIVEEEDQKLTEIIEELPKEEVAREDRGKYSCEEEEFNTETLRKELQYMKRSLGQNDMGVKFFEGVKEVDQPPPPAKVRVRIQQPEPMSYQVGADNLLKQIKKLQESKIKTTRRESMMFIEQVKDSLRWDFGEKYTKEVIQINPDLRTSTTRIMPQDPDSPYSQIYVKLNDFKILSVQADVRKKDGRVNTGLMKENVRKLLCPLQNLTDIQKRDEYNIPVRTVKLYPALRMPPVDDPPNPPSIEVGDLALFQKKDLKKKKKQKKGFGGFIASLFKTPETTFTPPPKPPPQCDRNPKSRRPQGPPDKSKPKAATAPTAATQKSAKPDGKTDPEKKEPVDLAKLCPPPKKESCVKIQDLPPQKPKDPNEQKSSQDIIMSAKQAATQKEKKTCKKPWEEHVCPKSSLDNKDQGKSKELKTQEAPIQAKELKTQEAAKQPKTEDPKDKKEVKDAKAKPEDKDKPDTKTQQDPTKCEMKLPPPKPVNPCDGDLGLKSFMEKECEKKPDPNAPLLERAKKAKEQALKDKELEDKKRRSLQYLEPKDIPCNPTIIDTALLTNPCCRKFPLEPVECNVPGQVKIIKSNFERAMIKEEKLLKEQKKPVSSASGLPEETKTTLCNVRGSLIKAAEAAEAADSDAKLCIHDKQLPAHECPICRKSQILDSPPKPKPRKTACKIGKCRKKGSKDGSSHASICSAKSPAPSVGNSCQKLQKKKPGATEKCRKPQFNVECVKAKVKVGRPGPCGITCHMKPCGKKKKVAPPQKKQKVAPPPATCPARKKTKPQKVVKQQTPKAKVVAILDEAIQQQRAKKCFKGKGREGKPNDCIKVVSACEKKKIDAEKQKQLERDVLAQKAKEKEYKKMKHTPWMPVKVKVTDNKFICKKPFPHEKRKMREDEERERLKRHHVLPDLSSKYQSPRFSKKCEEKKPPEEGVHQTKK